MKHQATFIFRFFLVGAIAVCCGSLLPVDIPVWQVALTCIALGVLGMGCVMIGTGKCQRCHGEGKIWQGDNNFIICWHCGGTGKR